MTGIKGLNCVTEKLCVPQDHLCDGVPDCVTDTLAFVDEMNCLPTPGTIRSIIEDNNIWGVWWPRG